MPQPIVRTMMGRRATKRGSEGFDLSQDIAYDYRRKIGAWVRDHRIAAELTQAELGDALGMGHSAISAVELGRSTISPERYLTLAKMLRVSQKELGEFMLRYTNPWLYGMIYGRRGRLADDLKVIPVRGREVPPL